MYRTRYLFAETNENTLRTDSQDYNADEILHTSKTALFYKTPDLQIKLQLFSKLNPNCSRPNIARNVTTMHGTGSGSRMKNMSKPRRTSRDSNLLEPKLIYLHPSAIWTP